MIEKLFEKKVKCFIAEPPAEMELSEKMKWIDERFGQSLSVEVNSQFNWVIAKYGKGLYTLSVTVEKEPEENQYLYR